MTKFRHPNRPGLRIGLCPQIYFDDAEFQEIVKGIVRSALKKTAAQYAIWDEQYETEQDPKIRNEIARKMLQAQVRIPCSHVRLLELAHELA